MPRIHLNAKAIASLRIPQNKRDLTATFAGYPGLQLHLKRAPGKTGDGAQDDLSNQFSTVYNWRFRYQKPHSTARTSISIGYYPDIDTTDIQAEHNHLRQSLEKGIDPQVDKLKEKIRQVNTQSMIDGFTKPTSVNSIFTRFKEDWPKTGGTSRSLRNYELSYEKYILSDFNGRDMRTITPSEWDEFVLGIANVDGKKGAAENVHKTMRRLFSYAVEKDILTANPLYSRKQVLPQIKGEPDEVFLASEEVHKLLNELHDQDCPFWLKVLIELMLRVGVRSQEWTRVKIGWINFPKMRIEHPPESMKNGKKAWTHLPENVVSLLAEYLRALKAEHGTLDKEMYLFHKKDPYIQHERDYFSRNFQSLNGWLQFTPKVFRKTISTHLQEHGCPSEVLRAIRNQALTRGVGKNYEFGDLFRLKKEWIERWQKILTEAKRSPNALFGSNESILNDDLASEINDLFG
ncbi:tyrosine-type recombinase/integrase [Pseudoalteromonas sp. DL2-H2.2]|uniref:tyrosine-type recombinase/integrase n=1 Tax=Pseudoalteromonas sp. DL2-H2.2 TaxID=2908889 RepID=UPI001F18A230|nr:tyrosine-type recombinase/integrase [Pseudoalteromonas sp. DL2-H2.2]MCF2909956.1 tyrosine-type recombinase/integrase [Pseudoalteromonas sp. DL2-H2.2]